MTMMVVSNRPFATDLITGFMLPDGIFVTMLGKQNINVQIENAGPSTVGNPKLYIESVSNPEIAYTAGTRYLPDLQTNAVRVEQWQADFTSCPSGEHFISFIVEDDVGNKTRIIKKIFVLGVTFDPATHTFHAETPEGLLSANFVDIVRPKRGCKDPRPTRCCCCHKHELEDPRSDDETSDDTEDRQLRGINKTSFTIANLTDLFEQLGPDFEFCPPGYLPHHVELAWTPTPPYAGQYSDLPFKDPWWKILLCILALLLLIAAAIAEALDGTGSVTVGGGTTDTGSPVEDCCGVRAGGGGTSPIAAGLVAAAAAAATAAGLSDVRDPIRRGQDATLPGGGELTLKELLNVKLSYPDDVALGRPFAVGAEWDYKRITTTQIYEASGSDINHNIHVASSYQIDAPEIVTSYMKDGEWIIKAQFHDKDGNLFRGSQLLVQCFLVGPQGQLVKLLLQDDGTNPDQNPSDGVYCGQKYFSERSEGLWRYYVIAQDVNHATPDMEPEEAAQIIGGMVLTHQLTITFDQDECPFVPDGHVMVV